VPAVLILQLEKVAMPEEAFLGLDEQFVRAAPPAGGVIAMVTGALLVVTVLPPASWMATTGCVAKEVPPVELEGLTVKASCVAGDAMTAKLALTALVSPLAAAVSV
jgi:hypothetical protein